MDPRIRRLVGALTPIAAAALTACGGGAAPVIDVATQTSSTCGPNFIGILGADEQAVCRCCRSQRPGRSPGHLQAQLGACV